jgi:DNA repair protein RadC
VYLNNPIKFYLKAQLSKGGGERFLVDVRNVFKSALELGATGLILCHNHPSGTLVPSERINRLLKLKSAGDSLEIKV